MTPTLLPVPKAPVPSGGDTATAEPHSVPQDSKQPLSCQKPQPGHFSGQSRLPCVLQLWGSTQKLQSHTHPLCVTWERSRLLLGTQGPQKPAQEPRGPDLRKALLHLLAGAAPASPLHVLWELGAVPPGSCSNGTVAVGSTTPGVTRTPLCDLEGPLCIPWLSACT